MISELFFVTVAKYFIKHNSTGTVSTSNHAQLIFTVMVRQEPYRGTIFELKFLPKMKLEIVAADKDVDGIGIAIVAKARTGEIGDGKIFILLIEDAVRFRTGDKGENAICRNLNKQ